MNPLDEVMTASEASKLWGIASITIRQACTGYSKAAPKFKPDEARRSGLTWLLTRAWMEHVFGEEPQT